MKKRQRDELPNDGKRDFETVNKKIDEDESELKKRAQTMNTFLYKYSTNGFQSSSTKKRDRKELEKNQLDFKRNETQIMNKNNGEFFSLRNRFSVMNDRKKIKRASLCKDVKLEQIKEEVSSSFYLTEALSSAKKNKRGRPEKVIKLSDEELWKILS